MKIWLPLLLGVSTAFLYLVTAQRAFYDDGIRFEAMLGADNLSYIHILYLPVVAFIRDVFPLAGIDAEIALKITAAVSGGAAVAMTCRIALETLIHPGKAVAVALLLAGLFGFWFHSTATELHAFHAAFASCLLLGLIRIVDAPQRANFGLLLLLFVGAFVTPASHASGVATGLPILGALYYAKGARLRMVVALGAGFAAWGGLYYYLYIQDGLFQGYSAAQSDKLPRLLANPGLLPGQIQAVAAELLLYSVPASTLIPAGFRVLRQRAPKHAVLCLLWILGWAILALPVGDRAYGSNFIATMPAQALLAVVALHGLATSPLRMVLVTALTFLPLGAFLWSGERNALYVYLGSALLLMLMTRPVTARPRWPFLLHLVLAGASTTLMLPIVQRDPIRDNIAAVSVAAGPKAMVLFFETVPNTHATWLRYFPGADQPTGRAFNPFYVQFLPAPEVTTVLDDYRRRIREQVARKGRLFAIYPKDSKSGLLRYQDLLEEFETELRRNFEFQASTVPDLFELRKRTP